MAGMTSQNEKRKSLLAARSFEAVKNSVPAFTGDVRSYLAKSFDNGSSSDVCSAASNGKDANHLHFVDLKGKSPAEVNSWPKDALDTLLSSSPRNSGLSLPSQLVIKPSKRFEPINTLERVRSLIVQKPTLSTPFANTQLYMFFWDQGVRQGQFANPDQVIAAAIYHRVIEGSAQTAEKLGWLIRKRTPSGNWPMVIKYARQIIITADILQVGLSAEWVERIVLLKDMQVGQQVRYPFLRPLAAVFYKATDVLWVEGFSPAIVGRGPSLVTGLKDFSINIHRLYQRLRRVSDHQRKQEDAKLWRVLCRYLDTTAYEERLPLTTRRVGTVKEAALKRPWAVEWEDGTTERVPLECAPANFAAFDEGTRFEAWVEYHSKTDRFMRIIHCERLPQISLTGKEVQDFWNNLKVVR